MPTEHIAFVAQDLHGSLCTLRGTAERWRSETEPAEIVRGIWQRTQGGTLSEVRLALAHAHAVMNAPRGHRIAFATTHDLRAALGLGQNAPDPLDAVDPTEFDHIVRVPEHVGADGSVALIPALDAFVPSLEEAVGKGCTVAAVCLANAPIYPVHEQLVLTHAHRAGFKHVAAGYEMAPDRSFPERAAATLRAAHVLPAIEAILAEWKAAVPEGCRIRIAGADGTLLDPDEWRGDEAIGSWNALCSSGAEPGLANALAGLDECVMLATRSHDLDGARLSVPMLTMIVSDLRRRALGELAERGVGAERTAWNAELRTGASDAPIPCTDPATAIAALEAMGADVAPKRIEVTVIAE